MYNKIKKQNGEKFAKTIRNYHNGILEIPELDRIVRYAGRDAEPIMSYLMSLLAVNDDIPAAGDPFDLLKQAGYNAFTADTLEKQNSIKHYFPKDELLCTFDDVARYKKFHIVHAIKESADKIQRADFNGRESRQDEYGTSVISIQMMKKGGFISIKNRYNHAVENCDNTFNSNPDNIIQGLSTALKDHFNVDFSVSKTALPEGYAVFDNQIFEYHIEKNNIYYGDGAWVENGTIYAVDKSAGDAMFDGVLFDNKTKTLKTTGDLSAFADDFNHYYGGNKGLYVKDGNLMLGDDVLIGAEKSQMKKLYLPAFTKMRNRSLFEVFALTHFDAPNLITAGNQCLYGALALKEFNAPNLITAGNGFLRNSHALTHVNLPALTMVEDYFLEKVYKLTHVNLPALITAGHAFLFDAPVLTHLNAPVLKEIGGDCLATSYSLEQVNVPPVKNLPNYILLKMRLDANPPSLLSLG